MQSFVLETKNSTLAPIMVEWAGFQLPKNANGVNGSMDIIVPLPPWKHQRELLIT